MTNWIKALAGSLCILTVLMHLIPESSFSKYAKFYAGLLFLLMAARPAIQLLAGDGQLERLLRLEFAKESYYDMETAIEGMADLKNSQISEAYQRELTRQIREITQACQAELIDIAVSFDHTETYRIQSISLTIKTSHTDAADALGKELSQVYLIHPDAVKITVQECDTGT